jgi:hypothetical protein
MLVGNVDRRIAELGYTLPPVNPPQGNYLPYQRSGNLVFVAGQGPRLMGQLVYQGILGGDLGLDEGRKAAQAGRTAQGLRTRGCFARPSHPRSAAAEG